jgi:hypothetical protein
MDNKRSKLSAPADSLALDFATKVFIRGRAGVARPIPPAPAAARPFLFSKIHARHFFLAIDGAGDRWRSDDHAAELGGRWQQHPARTNASR